ncbi:uncharacterized protein MICPUCDRAFT_53682 [Micromonas pusilla CCMP1545]|uniref:Predicted protein n=1 Tax=Micromonas pusilla (strain CCMP1545) TaxID=564608 RepID=C1N7G2_MICPC|nr:uncharacterized protein MICPUCDRAFT_53682 [Micromonas pusilla CCMP1545]EEH52103.1 predicted protein [Micromonas pusilla CCMP1545]|eukprot:XP_003063730.1 predicted protein [Micromonas pusilla CCMP1545]
MVAVLAVLIVAVAASCVNVGKALQKQGTKSLPREISLVTLPTYLADATWRRGLVLDICGGLLMVVALAIAPVSLVQPVASGGVAVLAVYSHVHLEEKLATVRCIHWSPYDPVGVVNAVP